MDVKPLPIAGQPAMFSGAVGRFDLRASVAASSVQPRNRSPCGSPCKEKAISVASTCRGCNLRRLEGVSNDLEDRRSDGLERDPGQKTLRAGSHSSARRFADDSARSHLRRSIPSRVTTRRWRPRPSRSPWRARLEPAASSNRRQPRRPSGWTSRAVRRTPRGPRRRARSSKARGHWDSVWRPGSGRPPWRGRDPALEAHPGRGKGASTNAAPDSERGQGRRVLRCGPQAHRRALREALGGRSRER